MEVAGAGPANTCKPPRLSLFPSPHAAPQLPLLCRPARRYPDRKAEPYLQELALLHEEIAQHLLLLCQSNGEFIEFICTRQLLAALGSNPPQHAAATG